MGEAGPEAIMPLKRGADGSLGVQANGLREAMNQDRAGGSGSPVLNMSFQSTNINGVEYVSRDQLEASNGTNPPRRIPRWRQAWHDHDLR
jgi:hypothetical protein